MWTTEHSRDTTVARKAIWRAWADVDTGRNGTRNIERIALSGPFATGSTIAMTPKHEETVHLRIAEAVDGEVSSMRPRSTARWCGRSTASTVSTTIAYGSSTA